MPRGERRDPSGAPATNSSDPLYGGLGTRLPPPHQSRIRHYPPHRGDASEAARLAASVEQVALHPARPPEKIGAQHDPLVADAVAAARDLEAAAHQFGPRT